MPRREGAAPPGHREGNDLGRAAGRGLAGGGEAGGEGAAATLAARLGSQAEVARELAYRLYTICERKKRAPEALSYNALVQSWPEIMRLARAQGEPEPAQPGLFD